MWKNKRGEFVVALLLAVIVFLLLIMMSHAFDWRTDRGECRTNAHCGGNQYCGADRYCHAIPNVQQHIVSNDFTGAGFLLGLSIIAAALIFRNGRSKKEHAPQHHSHDPSHEQHKHTEEHKLP